MGRSRRFREEAFGCLSISCGTEQKFQSVSLRIHSAIEVHPHFFTFTYVSSTRHESVVALR